MQKQSETEAGNRQTDRHTDTMRDRKSQSQRDSYRD